MKHKPRQHRARAAGAADAPRAQRHSGRPASAASEWLEDREPDHRDSRRHDGEDWVFGLHAVEALLKHNADSVQQLLVLQGRHDQRLEPLLQRARHLAIAVQEVARQELDDRVGGVHQGVAARCQGLKLERSEGFLDQLLENLDHPPFLLVLDGVTDPHNLGACLRTAEAAGVDAVIVPKDKSALMTPTARKVACGAAEVIPFIAVTNLARTLKQLQEKRIWVYGAAGEAEQSIYQTDLKGPIALVLGSEGTGMRRLTREHCDGMFSIPVAGEVSSLNVSVSAGVCLFEAVRQRAGLA